jgi:hypothetical protein
MFKKTYPSPGERSQGHLSPDVNLNALFRGQEQKFCCRAATWTRQAERQLMASMEAFIGLYSVSAVPNADLCDRGLNSRTAWRLIARRVAMRANSIGPLRSAALVISSAAVRTTGNARSDEGMVLTRCAIASRNDASLTPLGSSMGSAKGLSQDTTQLHNRTGISSGHGPTRFSVGRRISFPISARETRRPREPGKC